MAILMSWKFSNCLFGWPLSFSEWPCAASNAPGANISMDNSLEPKLCRWAHITLFSLPLNPSPSESYLETGSTLVRPTWRRAASHISVCLHVGPGKNLASCSMPALLSCPAGTSFGNFLVCSIFFASFSVSFVVVSSPPLAFYLDQ
jgi:hypothetical protein